VENGREGREENKRNFQLLSVYQLVGWGMGSTTTAAEQKPHELAYDWVKKPAK